MHYGNGTKAELGDVARGRGYNLPYDVQGVVVGLTPGQDSCNLHLLIAAPHKPLGTDTLPTVVLREEHGTCSAFELVHRAG